MCVLSAPSRAQCCPHLRHQPAVLRTKKMRGGCFRRQPHQPAVFRQFLFHPQTLFSFKSLPENAPVLTQVKGALERALMANRFRKEFVQLYIKTHVKNAELRVEKVPQML